MLRVEIWMIPNGDESKKFLHSTAKIVNDSTTTIATNGELGSYKVEFMQSYKFNPDKIWKTGKAKNIHRTKQGVWHILNQALKSILG